MKMEEISVPSFEKVKVDVEERIERENFSINLERSNDKFCLKIIRNCNSIAY
jgi:hypothetical protein